MVTNGVLNRIGVTDDLFSLIYSRTLVVTICADVTVHVFQTVIGYHLKHFL